MKRRWVGAALIGAMVLFSLAVWSQLPERVPTHWNIRGEVDGYSSRRVGALLLPGIGLLVWLLLPLLRRLDPRRDNYERFEETFHTLINAVIAYLGLIHVLALGAALGWDIDMSRAMVALVGVSFVVIGNFLPRIRSNWWMGIRTPWTLESERVWRETHRLAGWTFVAGGLVAIVAMGLPHGLRFPLAMAGLIGGSLVPVAASYVFWRRHGPEGTDV